MENVEETYRNYNCFLDCLVACNSSMKHRNRNTWDLCVWFVQWLHVQNISWNDQPNDIRSTSLKHHGSWKRTFFCAPSWLWSMRCWPPTSESGHQKKHEWTDTWFGPGLISTWSGWPFIFGGWNFIIWSFLVIQQVQPASSSPCPNSPRRPGSPSASRSRRSSKRRPLPGPNARSTESVRFASTECRDMFF